ncbi:VOC family protein [Pantoea sp. B65]|uniref:VOC family protein n=1 Tax=Pantoea sp. B65 TaxID=2813359 RepID=UPI0039B5E992
MNLNPVIDHAVINVDNHLDTAESLFRRMGFQLSDRGHHSMGSSNHLAIFGENYLELLGYEPQKATGARGLWQAPLGLAGLVWKTHNAGDTYHYLQTLQLDGGPPAAFSRPVILPDGQTMDARFCITRLAEDAIPNGFSFFCQHLTPEAVWQDAWRQHPNGVLDITEFVIMASQPAQAAAVYTRLFGDRSQQCPPTDSYRLQAGASCLRIITPAAASAEFGAVPAGDYQRPRMVALAFRVASLNRLEDYLLSGGVGYQRKEGQIVITPDSAFHVALRFQQ